MHNDLGQTSQDLTYFPMFRQGLAIPAYQKDIESY